MCLARSRITLPQRSQIGGSTRPTARRPTMPVYIHRAMRGMFHTNTPTRSEEHTSELQSQSNLVCRLLLEKKKNPTHSGGTYTDDFTSPAIDASFMLLRYEC